MYIYTNDSTKRYQHHVYYQIRAQLQGLICCQWVERRMY
jgi:hypothetical protein